jgi:hypothetical protein
MRVFVFAAFVFVNVVLYFVIQIKAENAQVTAIVYSCRVY